MLKKKFTAIALGLTLSASSLLASASAEPASAGAAAAAAKINDPAKGWDTLWYHVIRDISIIGVLFALVTAWFIWQSRRRPGNEVGASPKLSAASAVGWTEIPIFDFISIAQLGRR